MSRILSVVTIFVLAFLATGCATPPTPATQAALAHLIDRPRGDLDVKVDSLPDQHGFSTSHLFFTSEPGQRVPAIVLLPKEAERKEARQFPVVIVLHGTGGRKEGVVDTLEKFAAKGFIAVAMDGRYHGERSRKGTGTDDYFAAITQAYRDGKSNPWLYDTVFDVTRLIDYLVTRADVDPKRIALMGFSKGGMETYLAAAADPRVAVAVPCISIQSFAWCLANDQWHGRIGTVQGAFDAAAKEDNVASPDAAFVKKFYDRVIPGIDGPLDCPNVLPLICPRPLLTISGDSDKINPLPGAKIAIASATDAYHAASVDDRFRAEIEAKTGHEVSPKYVAEAVEWVSGWLIPPLRR